jgi:hypothetical protein
VARTPKHSTHRRQRPNRARVDRGADVPKLIWGGLRAAPERKGPREGFGAVFAALTCRAQRGGWSKVVLLVDVLADSCHEHRAALFAFGQRPVHRDPAAFVQTVGALAENASEHGGGEGYGRSAACPLRRML